MGPVRMLLSLRFLSFFVALALSLGGTPALAGPAASGARERPADAECWARVERGEGEARDLWLKEASQEAAVKIMSTLEIAWTCGQADVEQNRVVIRALWQALVDLAGFTRPSESQIEAVHSWYAWLAGDPQIRAELLGLDEKYKSFSATYPRRAVPVAVKPENPASTGLGAAGGARIESPNDGSVPPLRDPKSADKQRRARGLQLGGAGLLALGAGGLAAGFVSIYRVGSTSRALAEMCTPVCTAAADAAPLVARGELYENLAPALLTIGATIAIVGGALVGVGTKRRNQATASAPVPLLTPSFAGASWTLRF